MIEPVGLLGTLIARLIKEMRSEGPRYKSHDLGYVDSVSANRVDDWADELEAALATLPQQERLPRTQGQWFLTEQQSSHDCYRHEYRIGARWPGVAEHFIGRVYSRQDADFIVAAANGVAALPHEEPQLREALAILESPEKWMQWCDARLLERCEHLESQLAALAHEEP